MRRPTVSSLVVSRPQRLPLLHDAVRGWLAQTWDRRELVVVWGGPEEPVAVRASLGLLDRGDVRVVRVPEDSTLGARRNASIDAATGDLVVPWDDDDLYHPERIERQVAKFLERDVAACFLGAMVIEDCVGKRAWRIDHARVREPLGRLVHATPLFRRSGPVRYPEVGPESLRGEDTAIVLQLLRTRSVAILFDAPWLYVYRCHGANTVTNVHVAGMAARLAAPPDPATRASYAPLAAQGGPSYEDLGTPDTAMTWYHEALAAMPADSAEGAQYAAREAVRRGDTARGRALLESLVRQGAADLVSLVTLAGLYLADQTLGSARPILAPGLARYPNQPAAVAALASLAVAEGRFEEALRCFDQAADLAPWDPIVANDRAVVLARLGRTEEAIEALTAALDRDPTRSPTHDNLIALLPTGRARIAAYEALVKRHPKVREVHERLAAVLAAAGAHKRAHEVAAVARTLR